MGGIAFCQDPKAVEAITKEVKKVAKQPVIMKLSPNVTVLQKGKSGRSQVEQCTIFD